MKKIYSLIIIAFTFNSASAQFSHQNVSLLSDFDDVTVTAEPNYGIRYQSCWGWADTLSGREYGIIGSTTGTYVIEVTDPTLPIQRDYISSYHTNLIWHEYKTYGKYLYIVSDGPSSNQLQICDLSYLPDSVHVVYDSNALISRAHTISIDGNKMYLGSPTSGASTYSMRVYSLNNPEAPVLLRTLNQDYSAISRVHDMNVIHDTVYASCGYQGLFIYRYDSVQNKFFQIGSLTTYPDQGYNHSTVLSEDHSTIYMCDELPEGMGVKVVDVTTIATPSADSVFYTNVGDTPHNPYVKGNYLYVAAYQDGVYIYDISNPKIPVLSGYFDTHPQNGTTYTAGEADKGCWAVYTDLPSKTLLAADMQKGLFCLDATAAITGIAHSNNKNERMLVYPNPANDVVKIKLETTGTECIIQVIDLPGKELKRVVSNDSNGVVEIPVNDLKQGIYLVKATTSNKTFIRKINVVR